MPFKFRKYIHFLIFLCFIVQKLSAFQVSYHAEFFLSFPPCSKESLKTPNAFSPNNDGKNDSFCLEGWQACVKEFQVVIYNRYGEELFSSQDANFCWDGMYHGQVLENGIYLFVIRARMVDGEELKLSGNITLLK